MHKWKPVINYISLKKIQTPGNYNKWAVISCWVNKRTQEKAQSIY